MDPSSKSAIKKIVVMTRHGQRSPLIVAPGETYWKTPAASLTTKGATTMYSHGAGLRDSLQDFFKTPAAAIAFDKTNMRVYSSNLNRTVLSAYYFLRGVFQIPTDFQTVAADADALAYLNQYHFIRKPMKCDVLLRSFNSGTSKTMEENLMKQNEKYRELKLEFGLISKLLPMLPAPHKMTLENVSYLKLFYFYDYLKMYPSHDLPLPHGFPAEIYKGLEFSEKLLHELLYGHPTNIKLANYPLTLELTEVLTDTKTMFTLISAHDLNLSAFLRLFNVVPKTFPFGAYWMLVCYENGRVEITYHGDSVETVFNIESAESLINYMKKATYDNDSDYLRELRCGTSGNIMKAYREATCEDIEKELTI